MPRRRGSIAADRLRRRRQLWQARNLQNGPCVTASQIHAAGCRLPDRTADRKLKESPLCERGAKNLTTRPK
jgi:hypothetical protein